MIQYFNLINNNNSTNNFPKYKNEMIQMKLFIYIYIIFFLIQSKCSQKVLAILILNK